MGAFKGTALVTAVCLAGCSSDGGTPETSFELITKEQPAALLSVWATGPSNVWVVGGHTGTDGPIVEHFDGSTWTKLATGLGAIDLWWVHGFEDGTIFVAGSNGTIAKTTDGTTFTKLDTPPNNVTVFGLWGASSSDVWAVGGTGASAGFVWRYDGTTWTVDPDVPADITTGGTCWKVNGLSANNVWMAATNGTTLHWDGSSLSRSDIADAQEQQESLFSIDITSQRAIAVGGGGGTGVLYENTGAGWKSALPNVPILLSGVAATETEAYAVGGAGTILHRGADGAWVDASPTDASGQSLTVDSLHAVFIDPTGDVWSVGGNFSNTPTTRGVLLHKGTPLKGVFQ